MKISIYTFVKNGLFLDFHVLEMLKHHLPLADEIIVNEGFSSDSTYEKIRDIDPKIIISRSHWDTSDPSGWHRKFKNFARQQCTGSWCILLDCDEFIPEWEFDSIRLFLSKTKKDIIPLRYLNFYGNYKVYCVTPQKHNWPALKHTIHRNIKEIEVWGDGSNVKCMDDDTPSRYSDVSFECHHFGFVRHPARLRQKWNFQSRLYAPSMKNKWVPRFIFDLFPHKWEDEDYLADLQIYNGPYIEAVKNNPAEFTRDNFKLYNKLVSER